MILIIYYIANNFIYKIIIILLTGQINEKYLTLFQIHKFKIYYLRI